MSLLHPNAERIARKYLGQDVVLEELGSGIEGVVYKSPHEPSAIKIHARLEKFDAELAVYRRLRKRRVTSILGFSVPALLRSDRTLQVLELSVVKPPFLLDFAGATLDNPRDFTEEAMSDWWDRIRDNFGEDFPRARDVYWALIQQFGIYYYDLKPGNLWMR